MSRLRHFLLLLVLLGIPLSGPRAQGSGGGAERLIVLQSGFEVSQTAPRDEKTGVEVGQVKGTPGFDTNVAPSFAVVSRTFISKRACLGFGQRGAGEACGIGFGLRFYGGQRRLSGRWFDLESDPAAETSFTYNATQAAAEVLLGVAVTSAVPLFAIGYKAGINNYDLQVVSGDRFLVNQVNKNRGFSSQTVYLNLSLLFKTAAVLFGGASTDRSRWIPLVELSVENTVRNTLRVPDINSGEERKIDLRTRTSRIALQWVF